MVMISPSRFAGNPRIITVGLWGAILCLVPRASADVWVLTNGGRIQGTQIYPSDLERPAETYVVDLEGGGRIQLLASQVRHVDRDDRRDKEYEQRLADMPDSAAAHWAMAQWCQEQGLTEARRFHLERVVALDSNHEAARRALGYQRLNGQWMTQEEFNKQRGFQFYKGQWRLPQEVASLERRAQEKAATNQWRRDVRLWREKLGDRRFPEAKERLLELRDPAAAEAVAELFAEEKDEVVRQLLSIVLGQLDSPVAADALIDAALHDPDQEIRLSALTQLRGFGRQRAIAALIAALGSSDNRVVNRAAVGLAQLDAQTAIPPLIEALTTRHTIVVPTGQGDIATAFQRAIDGGPGGAGLSVGNRAKRITRQVNNKGVLEALIALSGGQNFQYAQEQWRTWYVQQHTPQEVNLRRGP